ncbi:MAG: hypothetical protein U0802_16690 [Candidatus Binatia bacterium]
MPSSDPDFAASGASFGVTYMLWGPSPSRLLTNGAVLPGQEIYGADILIAVDRLAAAAPGFTAEEQPKVFQRLLMHEIGHAIGLHHLHTGPTVNFDRDTDPDNAILIDPSNLLAGLAPPVAQPRHAGGDEPDPERPERALLHHAAQRRSRRARRAVPGSGRHPGRLPAGTGCGMSDGAEVVAQDPQRPEPRRQGYPAVEVAEGQCHDRRRFRHAGHRHPLLALPHAGTSAATLVGELALPPGASWQSKGAGFAYKSDSRLPHGVRNALLKTGAPDKRKWC